MLNAQLTIERRDPCRKGATSQHVTQLVLNGRITEAMAQEIVHRVQSAIAAEADVVIVMLR